MALFQIGNEQITIQVDSMGAEMKSLKKTTTGVEYMWEGNPAFWKRTSPVLFPIVGGLRNGEYIHNKKSYPMGQHGFARDMEFILKSQTNREIWFSLKSNEETLKIFPYEFLLE
ncbi:MAG: aldose 1-epimerase family protein, partial [Lachnospiraceae bacterium]|nr:aldose 1-epimerase family protein [Lachnospiraceae bacterium]